MAQSAPMRRLIRFLLIATCLCSIVHAKKEKDTPKNQTGASIVMYWPGQDNATLKLSFSQFQNLASYAGKTTLSSDVIVQNVSAKVIPRASFSVSLLDKDRVRVGSGTLVVDDLNPGDSAKIQFLCEALGPPAMLSLSARNSGGLPTSTRTIPMTVISVPAGASLKVDDKDAGLTPARINVSPGTHQLELRKEGFAVADTPLEVAPDEAPGGSITITLGGISDDTVELRDGSIITGTVVSMTLESVVIDVSGQQQTLDRNKVKKMFLVEHQITRQPAVTQTAPAESQPKQ
jgi:hypothetical protein